MLIVLFLYIYIHYYEISKRYKLGLFRVLFIRATNTRN
jgi:hypothetical protein